MLSTMKTRLKYYENVIDGLLHNVELTKELRHQDVKAVIDKYLKEMDFSWVKPESEYRYDGVENAPRRVLKYKGNVILDHSIEMLAEQTNYVGGIAMICAMAMEISTTPGFPFPVRGMYPSLEDKIAAYHIAKIYLQSSEDLTECFYDLKL